MVSTSLVRIIGLSFITWICSFKLFNCWFSDSLSCYSCWTIAEWAKIRFYFSFRYYTLYPYLEAVSCFRSSSSSLSLAFYSFKLCIYRSVFVLRANWLISSWVNGPWWPSKWKRCLSSSEGSGDLFLLVRKSKLRCKSCSSAGTFI